EFLVEIDGDEFEVKVVPTGFVELGGEHKKKRPREGVEGAIASSMQGILLKISVREGDEISEGDVVAVIEAMKMENEIVAPYSGTVEEIFVSEGDTVISGDIIMIVK
ncbi:MAG: biotin/lipoyl-containing protein, partial [Candidatus Hydrothermarchaeales archaeon]